MEEALFNLFSTLICLMPFCLGVLMFAGVAALIIRTVVQQSRPLTAQQARAEEEKLEAQVRDNAHRLAVWQPHALADLSTDWGATWQRWGRELKAHGTLPGVSRPKEIAWVAFALRVRGAMEPDGILHARTSGQTFDYRITRGGVAIRVNGVPFGQLQADGTLLDASGQTVGEARRPGGQLTMFQIGGVGVQYDGRAASYPLILHGQTVAHLAHPAPEMFNVIEIKKRTHIPALEIVDLSSPGAAEWAMALAILQVAGFQLLESVWTNQGGFRLKRTGRYKPFRFR